MIDTNFMLAVFFIALLWLIAMWVMFWMFCNVPGLFGR